MILHPTVIIGVGSTGKYIVADAQKYLYEVLNGEELKLFRFIVLETAMAQQDELLSVAGTQTKPVDIKVKDIGAAYFTLKQNLGDQFNWCPSGMQIIGQGAGNKRAGGRLMLMQHMDTVQKIIQAALDDVTAAAQDDATTKQINHLLNERGGNPQAHPLPNLPVPVVLVVGTLAGGTCSGTCVDLGYLLRRIAPNSYREAIFLVPDQSAIGTFKANSWAALADLAYFTENPSDYEVVWLNQALARNSYHEGAQTGPVPPYNHIYLVSQRDRAGNAHLPYRDDSSSPLLMMSGLCVAANLLGLYHLRQERLVDLGERVGTNPVYNRFLTHSVRGVSYPKYEISEAAACKIISDHVCKYWLSSQECYVQGRSEALQQEEISKKGREFWNQTCSGKWGGLRGNVDLPALAKRIKSGQITDVAKYLKAQLTENREDTIFRAIDQNVENRRRELQEAVLLAFVENLQQKQNLQYAEWFLDGVQSEIERARKYWQALGVPFGNNDMPAWQTKAGELSNRLVSRHFGLSVNMLGQRLDVIEDELEQIILRLEIFLMYRTFGEISRWAESELQTMADSIRKLLTDVQTFAAARAKSIQAGLDDKGGPLLKISRSSDRGFADEIEDLARTAPTLTGKEFIDYEKGNYLGLLCAIGQAGNRGKQELFQELLKHIQPQLIQRLHSGTPLDIVTEIERQRVKPQTVQRAHATQALSLPTRHDLMIGQENVPSLLVTRSTQSSSQLDAQLRAVDPSFPVLRREELPLFDHMALFYQEGGKFNLDSLQYGDDFKRAYQEARATDEAVLDPLRLLKKTGPPAMKATVATTPGGSTKPPEVLE